MFAKKQNALTLIWCLFAVKQGYKTNSKKRLSPDKILVVDTGTVDLVYYIMRLLGRSQVGKARDFDSRMRWFESSRPSHFCHLKEALLWKS